MFDTKEDRRQASPPIERCIWHIVLLSRGRFISSVDLLYHRHSRLQQCRAHRRGLRHLRLRTYSRRDATHQRPGMQPPLCIVLNRTNGITYQKHIFLMCSAEVTDFCYLCATMVQIQPYHQTYVVNGIPHIRPDRLLR